MTTSPGSVPLLSRVKTGARGLIGALARDGGGLFAVSASHLLEPPAGLASAGSTVRDSAELIGLLPIGPQDRFAGKVAYPWLRVDPDRPARRKCLSSRCRWAGARPDRSPRFTGSYGCAIPPA